MSAAILLDRLDRVTEHGSGRWRAVCPVHESRHRSQSLSVRETEDGAILVYCFAGCGAGDVVAAVGLSLSQLFPASQGTLRTRKSGRPNHYHAAGQALQTLHREVLIVLMALECVLRGDQLDEVDFERAAAACFRIRRVAEACR